MMLYVRILATLAIAGSMIAASAGQQPPGKIKASSEKKTAPRAPTFDEIVASAVRKNPEVGIAEAEVQLAQAKLNAVKVAAAQKVTALKARVEDAEMRMRLAEMMIAEAQKLPDAGAARAKKMEVEKDLQQARIQHAQLKAEWDQMADAASQRGVNTNYWTLPGQAQYLEFTPYRNNANRAETTPTRPTRPDMAILGRFDQDFAIFQAYRKFESTARPGSAAEQLRASLDRLIKLEGGKWLPGEAVEKVLSGASLKLRVKTPHTMNPEHFKDVPRIDIPSAELSLGSWLQLITDEVSDLTGKRYEFYLRDYGLLMATSDTAPPNALPLPILLKSQEAKAAEKTPEKGEKKK